LPSDRLTGDTESLFGSGASAHELAARASASRAATANTLSGCGAAWQHAGRSGFAGFIGLLEEQAARLRRELDDIGDKLQAASRAYRTQDDHSGGVLDSLGD
jgi:uncharacterized protein YukE